MKALTLILGLACACLQGQYYHARSLGVLPGYQASVATSINGHGNIAGYSFNRTAGDERAFLYRNCALQDLGSLGGGTSAARGLNDHDQVVGYSKNRDGFNRAFLWANGGMTDMGGPENTTEMAWGINNAGRAVGLEYVPGQFPPDSATMYNHSVQPVTYLPSFQGRRINQATAITDHEYTVGYSERANGEVWGIFLFLADYPGWHGAYRISPVPAVPRVPGIERYMRPNALNRHGVIVGAAGSYPRHAFLSPNFLKPAIDLGSLDPGNPTLSSEAMSINDAGVLVGWAEKAVGVITAFVYDGFNMIDLNTRLADSTGWQLLEARGINNKGQIVGRGTYNGQMVAFVLDPTPSPRFPPTPCIVDDRK